MAATDGIDVVMPGDILGPANEWFAGEGTYVRGTHVRAARLGVKETVPLTEEEKSLEGPTALKGKVTVVRQGSKPSGAVVPAAGNAVIGKVTRITPISASVDILVVDGKPVDEPFNGIIRKEHVRETEIDLVKMDDCFRPGDIIQAVVASLGDSRSYLLSTAKPEHGVIYALSEAGDLMVPINYEAMEAPSTGIREKRKCARPAIC